MEEKKKELLGALKKRLDGNDVVENQVIKLALKKLTVRATTDGECSTLRVAAVL